MRLIKMMLVLAVLCPALDAQQNQIRVGVQVPKAGSLGLGNAPSDGSQVNVRVRPDDSTVRLLARSNSAYRIQIRPAAEFVDKVRIVTVSASPNAGTAHLTSDALTVRKIDNLVLEGSRISSGGNNTTPDNAVWITVTLELLEGVEEVDLTLLMDFPG